MRFSSPTWPPPDPLLSGSNSSGSARPRERWHRRAPGASDPTPQDARLKSAPPRCSLSIWWWDLDPSKWIGRRWRTWSTTSTRCTAVGCRPQDAPAAGIVLRSSGGLHGGWQACKGLGRRREVIILVVVLRKAAMSRTSAPPSPHSGNTR